MQSAAEEPLWRLSFQSTVFRVLEAITTHKTIRQALILTRLHFRWISYLVAYLQSLTSITDPDSDHVGNTTTATMSLKSYSLQAALIVLQTSVIKCIESLAEEEAFTTEIMNQQDVLSTLETLLQSSNSTIKESLLTYHTSRLINLLMSHSDDNNPRHQNTQRLVDFAATLKSPSASLHGPLSVGAKELNALLLKSSAMQQMLEWDKTQTKHPTIFPMSLNMWHAMGQPSSVNPDLF